MMSSADMPEARYSNTSYTVIRIPRMQGSPPLSRFDGDAIPVVHRHRGPWDSRSSGPTSS